ncbi:MAG: hypothetical protein J0L88_08345 [Xanthomonadales bacterium]|nr:hypothetical protein [Xanthomonadales bacterium]
MQVVNRFELEAHAGPYESWPRDSRLRVDGRVVDVRVPGYVIDAQYRVGDEYLLVTSFDCPYEEASAFVLLDASSRMRARRTLGAATASYLLADHWPIDAATLGLHYHGDLFFTLHVAPSRRWSWLRRRLVLRACPGWRDDPRMREAQQRLAAQLASIRTALDQG